MVDADAVLRGFADWSIEGGGDGRGVDGRGGVEKKGG